MSRLILDEHFKKEVAKRKNSIKQFIKMMQDNNGIFTKNKIDSIATNLKIYNNVTPESIQKIINSLNQNENLNEISQLIEIKTLLDTQPTNNAAQPVTTVNNATIKSIKESIAKFNQKLSQKKPPP